MKDFLSTISHKLGFLNNPGDSLEARVTKSNRKVLKANIDNTKYSATKYPNGTVVETRVTKDNK